MSKEKTLDEAALNEDGKTYNGIKLIQFLYKSTTGLELSVEEAEEMIKESQQKAKRKRDG